MESWNSVINTALLGTEKRSLKSEDVDPAFAESFALVQEHCGSREDAFLQSAALVYNYRQCGFLPLQKEAVFLPGAEVEENGYASGPAHAVLSDVLDIGSVSLLAFWLEQCSQKNRFVQPEVIPVLLNAGIKNRRLETLVNACCGKRGRWLRQFNPEWKKGATTTEEERWEAGTLAERKAVLMQVREQDPAKARELLQQTWPQESAATRAELLEALLINAGEDDLPWLEEVQHEKSVKVKEVVLRIMKTIPGSSVVQGYWHIVQQSVSLQTTKGLLGIGRKTELRLELAAVPPDIFKTGIQELPEKANVKEEDFILFQLVGYVPPKLWETHLGLSRKELLELICKDEQTEKTLLGAIGLAASRFRDLEWLRAVTDADEIRQYGDAFELLPQKEAEAYALRFLDRDLSAAGVLNSLHHFKAEWGHQFAKAVLQNTAKNPYQYHRGFYNDLAAVLPFSITGELETVAPKEAYQRSVWSNLSVHITQLVSLKQQTVEAFRNT